MTFLPHRDADDALKGVWLFGVIMAALLIGCHIIQDGEDFTGDHAPPDAFADWMADDMPPDRFIGPRTPAQMEATLQAELDAARSECTADERRRTREIFQTAQRLHLHVF